MGRTPLNVLQQFRVASRSRLFASTQRHRAAILRFQNVVSVSSVAFPKRRANTEAHAPPSRDTD